MDPKRILVVDDEPQITRVLRRSLGAHKYNVRVANDGETALDTFHDFAPDLIITDLSMPEMSGMELCREIRRQSAVPIIVLSVRGEEKAKVDALDAGADDYITKPFGIDELLARVRAALRRAPAGGNVTVTNAGDFAMDTDARRITFRGENIHLTPKEYELLSYLFINRDKVITHRTLLAAVWGGEFTEQTEYLRVFIGTLRKKVEPDPSKPKYILTEPWIGYRFSPGEE